MRIIDRYLLRELALSVTATAVVLVVITVGGTFADVLNRVASGRVPGAVMFPVLGLRVLEALSVLLPVALFLGVMMALSRMYRDNEMHVLGAAGMGAAGLLRPAALLALPVALLTALISLWLGPLAMRTSDAMVADANRSVIAAGLEPGRFVELPRQAGVIFVESMDSKGTVLGRIFVENERGSEPARIDLVTAARGELYQGGAEGSRYLALHDGYRYEGSVGHDDWKRMRFARNDVALAPPGEEARRRGSLRTAATRTLLASADLPARVEFAWRASHPLSVLVLALLAIALSRQAPREARYGRLLVAVLVYLLYSNVLSIVRAGLLQGRVPDTLGLWWVHALLALTAGWIVWQQYRVPRTVEART